ncbi:A/G-specific DNA-adenine glycosylase [Breoghania corrubedonensis]|uniref:Adenine DNA glycosylase n=1 Tax=Breoghania corrubedonensis TaxID=665038 RepID=A0A2T5VEQ5_9HYPH|nr:A/G-specific adenine glycosylase [Breoghania corrubedonensis]PTW62235.1 A/G-specific DNA-adenine glycosylase [Breoghania corrubedonensis]
MDQRFPAPEAQTLLDWYDRHARALPWRVPPEARQRGVVPDPYRVWLSEIMLQQTTVAAVKAYFEAFTQKWPDVNALAAADEADVMKAWAGLGYYSRARNLKACADTVARDHAGKFPDTEEGLVALPGIGPYTAAAIAAIAFDRPATVVDGNVERVISRIHALETPLPQAKPDIRALTAAITPETRPGDFAQAMMDLGATLCSPKRPACSLCPWQAPCRAQAAGTSETFPRKAPKAAKPTRRGMAFVAVRSDGAVLLRRRPPKGLLGGMSEPPTSTWAPDAAIDDTKEAPLDLDWKRCQTPVRHTFTHFHLEMTVWHAHAPSTMLAPEGHWWSPRHELGGEALPTVMKKAVAAGLGS